jgi:ABC-2 type transport system ATP-binding protein
VDDDARGAPAQTRRYMFPTSQGAIQMSRPVEFDDLSKHFGGVAAVEHLTFGIEAGRVTGFLGPNGAGKSTTIRALLGLIRPSSGSATFGGIPYEQLDRPSARVGAVLEDASFHPGRSARNHLRIMATIAGHPASRVDEVLEMVGLTGAADRPVKGYSLGMRQRLAIAAALLGKPDVLILDEPTNGLDPPGISWLRGLLRAEAARGAAVLISSHVLAEVALSVDDVVVIADGKLRAVGTLEQVLGGEDGPATEVRAHDPERLTAALEACGLRVQRAGDVLSVMGASPEQVGEIAGREGVAVLGLAAQERSLEEAFLSLTGAAS